MPKTPAALYAEYQAQLSRIPPPRCLNYMDDSDFQSMAEYVSDLCDLLDAHVRAIGEFCASNSHEVKDNLRCFEGLINEDTESDIRGVLQIAAAAFKANHAGDYANQRMTEERV